MNVYHQGNVEPSDGVHSTSRKVEDEKPDVDKRIPVGELEFNVQDWCKVKENEVRSPSIEVVWYGFLRVPKLF